MKIAYVVPYVPNLIKTRPYNLITQLSTLGHEVTVFTLGSSMHDLLDASTLRKRCREVIYYVQPVWRSLLNSAVAIPSRHPLQSVYSWHIGMAQKLTDQISRKEYDV